MRLSRHFSAFLALFIVAVASIAEAARPSAAKLLPIGTVAVLRIPDVKEMHARFMETGMGRMSQDPQLQPLVRSLYGVLGNAFANVDKQLELSLDELLAIPQGEIAVALVAPEDRRPAVVFVLDVGDHLPAAQKLIDRAKQVFEANGATKTEENVNGVNVSIFESRGDAPPITYLEREGTIVVTTDLDVAKGVLERWNGSATQTLADNDKYAAISKSNHSIDDESHIAWFVDPIAMVRGFGQGNPGAQIALAALPALGLDGLQGIGGSMTFSTGEFDGVQHLHVLLDEPRAGIVELLAMGSGDATPERWVPADAVSYTTLYWDFQKTWDKLSTLVDSFQGQGAFAGQVRRRASERIGADIEREIIPALDGRVTHVNLIERPVTLNSNGTLVALKLKDPKIFTPVLDKIIAKFPEAFEKKSLGGVTYYVSKGSFPNPDDSAPKQQLCLGVFEGCLMLADRNSLMERTIAMQHSGQKTLADSLEFKLIASKISRQAGGLKPGMVNFNRPEESMRFVYDLAQAERSRQGLTRLGENNPFFKSLNAALEENPLPPFEVLSRYLAPGGGMMVNDETGFHWTAFTLKRK
jgi:hypothetical protein